MPVQAKTKKHKPTRMWLQLCSFCLSQPKLRPYCQTPKPSRKKWLRLPGLSWRRLAAGWASLSGIFRVGRLYTVQRIFICKYWSVAPPPFFFAKTYPSSECWFIRLYACHQSCGEKFANARDLAFFVDEAATFMKERLPLVPGDLPFMAVMKLKEGLS